MKNYDAKKLLSEMGDYCRWRVRQGLCTEDDCLSCCINKAHDKVRDDATMKTTRVHIYNIKWDVDGGDDSDLPKDVCHTFQYDEDDDELEDLVSDWLSDEYGFCHEGFEMEEVKD